MDKTNNSEVKIMNTKNKYKILIAFICISSIFATDIDYTGGYAGSFLRMGLSARNQAMGNSGVALSNSSADFYYNPGLIVMKSGKSLTTGYSFLSLDRKFNFLSLNWPLPPTAAININWIHAGVNNIQGRNYSGYQTKKYETSEDAIMLTFGNKLSEKFAIGFSLKYLRHSLLEVNGSGVGIDLGVVYQILPNLMAGLQIKDINSSYYWKTTKIFHEEGNNYKEKFPTVTKFGCAFGIYDFIFVTDIVNFEGDNYFHGGMEYNYQEIGSLRVGYGHSRLTFGCGLKYDFMCNTKTELDYAFVQEKYGEGHSHVFTWNFKI